MQILIFDYRCRHRGLANDSSEKRPVAYVVYNTFGSARDTNFPSATTLEYD